MFLNVKLMLILKQWYCGILLLFKINVTFEYCKMYFFPVMQSWIFSIITPVFSVTWSSEISLIYWFAAQETFIIINAENLITRK